MFKVVNAPADAALAARLEADLQASGAPPVPAGLLVAVLSPAAISDPTVQAALEAALDAGRPILPVLAAPTPLPKLVDHLPSLDFSAGYNPAALRQAVEALAAPDAGLPLKVITPRVRRANRRIGYWLAALALFWFVTGLILVGVFGVQAPRREYDAVETEIVLTRDYYLERNQPRTTEDAANFPATLQAAPTAQRPFLVETATAIAGP